MRDSNSLLLRDLTPVMTLCSWDDDFVDEIRRTFKACKLFVRFHSFPPLVLSLREETRHNIVLLIIFWLCPSAIPTYFLPRGRRPGLNPVEPSRFDDNKWRTQ